MGLGSLVFGPVISWSRNELRGQALSVGNPCEISILEVAHGIKAMTMSKSEIAFHSPDDPERRCPDISKATRMLGWRPNVVLEDGLRRVIAWFQQQGLGDAFG